MPVDVRPEGEREPDDHPDDADERQPEEAVHRRSTARSCGGRARRRTGRGPGSMIMTSAVDISIHAVSPVSIVDQDLRRMAQDGPGHGRRLGRRSARVVPAGGPRRCRFGAARRIVAPRGCEPGSGGRRMEPEYDAAVIEDEIAAKHDLRFVTWTGAATSAAFFLLVLVTTQVDSIQAVLPFTDDPYDAVTWFSVIAIAIVGGATIVRAIGHRSESRRSRRRAPDRPRGRDRHRHRRDRGRVGHPGRGRRGTAAA